MSWIRRWRSPQRMISYCLGSWYAPSSCFLAQLMLSHCSLVHFFVCQTYTVTLLEIFCLKREKSLLEEIVQLIVVLFAAEFVVSLVVCLSFFWFSCLEAPLWTTIVVTVEHVFERDINCLTQIFNCFFPSLSLSCTPNLFWARGICNVGAPKQMLSESRKIGGTR